jgi:hypothetical protein
MKLTWRHIRKPSNSVRRTSKLFNNSERLLRRSRLGRNGIIALD